MGLKVAGVVGSFPGFGSVTICALSISCGRVAEIVALWNTLDMWGESMVLNVLKYSLEKPSGLGDFPFGRDCIVFFYFLGCDWCI